MLLFVCLLVFGLFLLGFSLLLFFVCLFGGGGGGGAGFNC